MSMPEFAVMAGVQRAWDIIKAHPGEILAAEFKELSRKKQKDFREMIEAEDPTIHLAYPTNKTRLPAFSVILQSETEEETFLDDAGPDDRVYPYNPYNPLGIDPYEDDDMGGIVYDIVTGPLPMTVSGAKVKESVRTVRRTARPKKNQDMQRGFLGGDADEQFEKMGEPKKVWDRNEHKVTSRSWIDRVNVGVLVTATNAEKTFVYYRLLRTLMRLNTTWFSRNGIKVPSYSGSDLQSSEMLGPAPIPNVFQRMLIMSFKHETNTKEVEAIIRGWEYEITLVTNRADGGTDEVKVLQASGDGEIE